MMREETADYDVVPLPGGAQKQLKLLTGRYWNKAKYVAFQGEPVPEACKTAADLIHKLRNHEPVIFQSSTFANFCARVFVG